MLFGFIFIGSQFALETLESSQHMGKEASCEHDDLNFK